MKKLIIGISGKIGSGKDTLANQIIAFYLNAMDPEKRTFVVRPEDGFLYWRTASWTQEMDPMYCEKLEFASITKSWYHALGIEIINFADALKRFVIDVLGCPEEKVYGTQADKAELSHLRWDDLPPSLVWEERGDETFLMYREVLQLFGSDLIRRWYAPAWANACLKAAMAAKSNVVLVPDTRFPDELRALQLAGAKTIRLLRNPEHRSHWSEVALDDVPLDQYDLVIPGNVTVEGMEVFMTPHVKRWMRNALGVRGSEW